MPNVIKLPEEYLKKIKLFQERYLILSGKLGEIELQKANLEAIKTQLLNEYLIHKQEEKEIISEIEEKYGLGRLDMNTGELTVFDENK